jgi:hypothetical protein
MACPCRRHPVSAWLTYVASSRCGVAALCCRPRVGSEAFAGAGVCAPITARTQRRKANDGEEKELESGLE